MRKKMMTAVLSCLTTVTLALSPIAAIQAYAVSESTLNAKAVEMISRSEGTYGSINRNDVGALSIGMIQWHGDNALNLMRKIIERDPATTRAKLGEALYNEVMTTSSWAYRTVSTSEAELLSAALTTDAGVAIQNEEAANYVSLYFRYGRNYGITDAGVMLYYADLCNRGVGVAAGILNNAKGSGGYGAVTLEQLHQTALNNSSSIFYTRLNRVYETAKAYVGQTIGEDEPAVTTTEAVVTTTVTTTTTAETTPAPTETEAQTEAAQTETEAAQTEAPQTETETVQTETETVQTEAPQTETQPVETEAQVVTTFIEGEDDDVVATAETEKGNTPKIQADLDGFSESYNGTYRVIADIGLNLRSLPSMNGNVIGSIPENTVVEVTLSDGTWAQVTYYNVTGYCSMSWLESTQEAPTTTLTTAGPVQQTTVTTTVRALEKGLYQVEAESLYFRNAPSTLADVITVLHYGTVVEVTWSDYGWAQATVGGKVGYMSMDYLSSFTGTTTQVTQAPVETLAPAPVQTEAPTQAPAVQTTAVQTMVTLPPVTKPVETVVFDNDADPAFVSLYGDVNCDSSVDVTDLVLLAKFASDSVRLNVTQLANGDVRRDGTVNNVDVNVLMQYLASPNTRSLPIV